MRFTNHLSVVLLMLSIPVIALMGVDIDPPSCAKSCMVNSMFITNCIDINCLCHDEGYQKSLFQCLYSQCDTSLYGGALLHTIQTCLATGAQIYMVAPTGIDNELLRQRELQYLAGRQDLPEIPGLHLRQDSAGPPDFPGLTTTTWVTATTTMTGLVVTPFPGASGQAGNGDGHGNGGGELGPLATVTNTITMTTTVPPLLPAINSAATLATHDISDAVTSLSEYSYTTTPSRPWMVTTSRTTKRDQPSFAGLIFWVMAVIALDVYISAF